MKATLVDDGTLDTVILVEQCIKDPEEDNVCLRQDEEVRLSHDFACQFRNESGALDLDAIVEAMISCGMIEILIAEP